MQKAPCLYIQTLNFTYMCTLENILSWMTITFDEIKTIVAKSTLNVVVYKLTIYKPYLHQAIV